MQRRIQLKGFISEGWESLNFHIFTHLLRWPASAEESTALYHYLQSKDKVRNWNQERAQIRGWKGNLSSPHPSLCSGSLLFCKCAFKCKEAQTKCTVLLHLAQKDWLQRSSRVTEHSPASALQKSSDWSSESPLMGRRDGQISDPSCSGYRIYQRETRFLHSHTFYLSQFFCWTVSGCTHRQHKPPAVLVLCSRGKFHETPSI